MAKAGRANLEETHPLFALQFNRHRNIVSVEGVSGGSSQVIWWSHPSCGHEWAMRVSTRVAQGPDCPVCAGKVLVPGVNDLSTLYPQLGKEWNASLNGGLTASDFLPRSGKKVWWTGSCGHDFCSAISHRVSGSNCSLCNGNWKVLSGVNDLATHNPAAASEWHPTKNEPITPQQVRYASRKIFWWKCEKDHEWEASCYERRERKGRRTGCPICSGAKVVAGYNDIFTLFPLLKEEWDFDRNEGINPLALTRGSGQRVWWKCREGHEWGNQVNDRMFYRTGCPVCMGQVVQKGYNDLLSQEPLLAAQWHPTKNGDLTPSDVMYRARLSVWWQCDKGHEWYSGINSRQVSLGNCYICGTGNVSALEAELADFIEPLLGGVLLERGSRSLLRNRELDIYIPSRKFAVEFNGIYWHSEARGKDRNYHHDKWKRCKEAGVQLVQVWEDEWRRNPEQIKRMLAHKLSLPYGEGGRVMARKTSVHHLSKKQVEVFLESHHVQGFAAGSYYLGLREVKSNKLVAVLVLKKEPGTDGKTLNIIRYASSMPVSGGFTKLLKYAERKYEPESFITFSDNCVSDGGLYERNGFVVSKELPPDYMYVVGNERKHKFGYRLKRFKNDSRLLWEEGLSERELAKLNGLHRIWDAGKTRWTLTVSKGQ